MKPLLFLMMCGPILTAQVRGTGAPEAAVNLPAQKIGPSDLIMVQVYDSPELTRSVRVGADGSIRLPMLQQPVPAQGLMPGELEASVAAALQQEGLLVQPYVTITVSEYSSRPISVAGAVKSPLTFFASSTVTLLEAVTRAGGLTAEAGPDILVSTRQSRADGEPDSFTRRIKVKVLIDSTDPGANIELHGGEEIRIPDAGKVFVVGNVKRPGAFAVQDGAATSVMKVLAMAEGLAPFAGKQAFIYRREASGNRNEILVELSKIMDRKVPDAPLLANDVLYIPDNHGRRLGIAALEKLLMFGSTAGATALIFR